MLGASRSSMLLMMSILAMLMKALTWLELGRHFEARDFILFISVKFLLRHRDFL